VEQNKGPKGQAESNWEDNLEKIFSFKNLEEFGQFWYNCSYDDSSNLLYSSLDDTQKNVKRKGKLYTIDGVGLFREGISPAWEDEANEKGYELRAEVDVSADKKDNAEKVYKNLWQNLVFGLIGEDFEYSKEITGIRFKYQSNRMAIRIEIWIKTLPPESLETKVEKALERPQVIENLTDIKSKVYASIKYWIEDKIKTVKNSVPTISHALHKTTVTAHKGHMG